MAHSTIQDLDRHSSPGVTTSHYTGAAGRRYFEGRVAVTDDESQRKRAAYFAGLSRETDTVLDFGCGTGRLLSFLPAARRVGVDVAEIALEQARGTLDQVFCSLDDIPPQSVDVAITFHAVEHVAEPYAALCAMYRALRPGGTLKIYVPYDNVLLNWTHRRWTAGDPIRHLYTWTPLTLGNLLGAAGFSVIEAGLSPWATGGRLAHWLKPVGLAAAAPWLKAMRAGRIQVFALAKRPE
jgi:SAM-dependent methyltransferase